MKKEKWASILTIVSLLVITGIVGFLAFKSEEKYTSETKETGTKEYLDSNYYTDTTAPSFGVLLDKTIDQYDSFNPMTGVTAHHSKFGNMTDEIEITYNNLNTKVPGKYTIVYRVCNYKGSKYCATDSRTVTVKAISSNTSYTKTPVWSNTGSVTCEKNDTDCRTYNIAKPVARDPYTNEKLSVTLKSGEVNIYASGTYLLVYQAKTNHGIIGTITKKVTIKNNKTKKPVWSNEDRVTCEKNDTKCIATNISKPVARDPYTNEKLTVTLIKGDVDITRTGTYSLTYQAKTKNSVIGTTSKKVTIKQKTLPQSKYVSNYSSSYYDNGTYAGYLTRNTSTDKITRTIKGYKKYYDVKYTYRCKYEGYYGTDGWEYVSTDTKSNYPTIEYKVDTFRGTLNRVKTVCTQGCSEKLIPELGLCKSKGTEKQITRSFLNYYDGKAYSYQNVTYSGYVYLK